jgi:hypothetical protein
MIEIDGRLYRERDFAPNVGLRQTIDSFHRRGRECSFNPCTRGQNCTYLHRATATPQGAAAHANGNNAAQRGTTAAAQANAAPAAPGGRGPVPNGMIEIDGQLYPERDFVPNIGLRQTIDNFHRRGRECSFNPCRRGDDCAYLHRMPHARPVPSSGAQPNAAMMPAGHQNLVVCIVVDGYWFATATGRAVDALASLKQFVKTSIERSHGNATVRFPTDACVFLLPDPEEALNRRRITDDVFAKTLRYCHAARSQGWIVVHSKMKLDRGNWRATSEDVNFANRVNDLAAPGKFDPVGAKPERVTADHIALVTNDKDHRTTLDRNGTRALRWCVSIDSEPLARELLAWGEETQRRLVMPQHPAQPTREQSAADCAPRSAGSRHGKRGVFFLDREVGAGFVADVTIGTVVSFDMGTNPKNGEPAAVRIRPPGKDGLRGTVINVSTSGYGFILPDTDEVCTNPNCCGRDACGRKHATVSIDGADVNVTQLLNTAGKRAAMADASKAIKRCSNFPGRCTFGFNCHFAHMVAHPGRVLSLAALPPVPAGMIEVNGRQIAESEFVQNAGLQSVIEKHHRRGRECTNNPCRFGDKCTFLHRRVAAEVQQRIDALRTVSAGGADLDGAASAHGDDDDDDDQHICGTCSEDLQPRRYVECPEQEYRVCNDCFNTWVSTTWMERPIEAGVVPAVTCPCGCGHVYTATIVVRRTSDATSEAYLAKQQQAREAIVIQDMQEKTRKGQQDQVAREQLRRELQGTALMCPRCLFGPVTHAYCDDLRAHHGERVTNGIQIDNSCPVCKFFGSRKAEWRLWDGVFPEERARPAGVPAPAAAAPPPPLTAAERLVMSVMVGSSVRDAQRVLDICNGDLQVAGSVVTEVQSMGRGPRGQLDENLIRLLARRAAR